jgi:integrase
MTILNKHILPRWQYTHLAEVRPMFVQDCLDQVRLAPNTKAKIKALMHRLFEKAMFWELMPVGRNPMALVEIQGASRRRKKPIILTVEQYFAVLGLLPEPYRTMVVVALCLGLTEPTSP